MADRPVQNTLSSLYHYSVQKWGNVRGLQPSFVEWDPSEFASNGAIKTASVELLREEGYKVWNRRGDCWKQEDIAISRIHYSDSATKISVVAIGADLTALWNTIMITAQNYRYAEQPGSVPPFINFPYSIYLIGDNKDNSNTIARYLLSQANIAFRELGGLHPGNYQVFLILFLKKKNKKQRLF